MKKAIFLVLFSWMVVATQAETELQGKWSTKRPSGDGTHVLEFKNDKMTFKVFNGNGDLAFFAKGNLKVDKVGALKVIKLTGIEWGESESDTSAANDDRTIVYSMRYGNLLLATNFDKERDDEEPKIETYTKVTK